MIKTRKLAVLSGFLNGFRDLVYPKVCVVCKQRLQARPIDSFVCFSCWAKIKMNVPPFCHHCGRRLKNTNLTKHVCSACAKKRMHFDRAFSPCVYEGVLKSLIHEFKYSGKDYLGRTLSRLMITFIKEYEIPMDFLDFIIPVPLHPARFREREFNQAEVISSHIAAEFGNKLFNDILIRHRYTTTQTELETEKRLSNVEDSFSVKEGKQIKGKNILLIDDVLTTGATASNCAKALKNAEAGVVFVLTLTN